MSVRLRILHCLRAPVGGLFRHVVDLSRAQVAAGHRVGIVCAATGDALTEVRLLALAPSLQLGLHRLPMGRELGFTDIVSCRRITRLVEELTPDVVHGHGAKGGAYARLAARTVKRSRTDLKCFYTPHGGSLHYPPSSIPGQAYGALERRLERYTDGILFESQFAADRYARQIRVPEINTSVIYNGVTAAEFEPVHLADDAADFVFVGELRHLKGVDVALDALAHVNRTRPATAVIVGDGPDAAHYKMHARRLGIEAKVIFPGALEARVAFGMGRTLLVPSRAESLPYIVIEAIAAGLPVLATNVGGIPEIIPSQLGALLPPGDSFALGHAMCNALDDPERQRAHATACRAAIQQRFTVAVMAAAVTSFYDARSHLRQAA